MEDYRLIPKCRSACGALILTLFIGVVVAQSQENSATRKDVPPELVSLTDQVIREVPETDRSGVLVLDFKGPDGASSFGGWLADQLSLAMAKSDNTLAIIDRAQLAKALEARHLSRKDMFDAKIRDDVVAAIGAHTVVMGSFGAADNGIGVTLWVKPIARIDQGLPLSDWLRTKMALTGIVASNLGVPLASLRPKDGIFRPGEGGVSMPLCVSCPRAALPASFRHHKDRIRLPFKGTVELMAVVTLEGNVTNVEVVKALKPEFDAEAVAAVSHWRLKPAADIDGNPVPVHQVIEVTFELY